MDLPGTYSLSAYSPEELYVRQNLVEEVPDFALYPNSFAIILIEKSLSLKPSSDNSMILLTRGFPFGVLTVRRENVYSKILSAERSMFSEEAICIPKFMLPLESILPVLLSGVMVSVPSLISYVSKLEKKFNYYAG